MFLSSISQFNLIWIAIPSFLLLVFILIFILFKVKKVIKAKDGTVFKTKEECSKYDKSCEKINKLFNISNQEIKSLEKMGFNLNFINNIKTQGFQMQKLFFTIETSSNFFVSFLINESY